jgi:hypothetical protein
MTIYALNVDQVRQTIRDTLVERVLPSVESGSARGELLAVIEMLDNLDSRLTWDPAALEGTVSRTRALGVALGQVAGAPEGRAPADDIDALRADRRSIGEALSAAYSGGFDPAVVRAVVEFTADDVTSEISKALRPGLPD